jgi:outer membrane protein assembly factor BamB
MENTLFIGSNGHVCAINTKTGNELWRTRLQESFFGATRSEDVSVLVRDGVVFAGANGHLFGLSAQNGQVLWHNELKGLRFNDICLAMEGVSVQFVQKVVHRSSNSSGNNNS